MEQGKSEEFDSCNRPSIKIVIFFKLDSNDRFFSPCDLEISWMTLKNYRAPLLHDIKLCASSQTRRWIQIGFTVRKRSIWVKIGDFLSRVTLKFDGWPWKTIGHLFYVASSFVQDFITISEFKLMLVRKRSIQVKIGDFFVPWQLEIWRMTLKNNRAPLLCYFKLCASFQSHRWIQTGVTVRKRSIWVKISYFLSHVTLKFDGWPWKTIGHLFYVVSSFAQHFITIREFKLKLVRKRSIQVKIGDFFVPWELEIWQMTLKNNRAPLLCYFKFCASFQSHRWIQTGVTLAVLKRSICVKIGDFYPVWPWNLMDDLEKQ